MSMAIKTGKKLVFIFVQTEITIDFEILEFG